MQLEISRSFMSEDDSNDWISSNNGNSDNTWKWMNKLISLINTAIEKGRDPVDFRHSVNVAIEVLLGDVQSGEWWSVDYFVFRVYELVWTSESRSWYPDPTNPTQHGSKSR